MTAKKLQKARCTCRVVVGCFANLNLLLFWRSCRHRRRDKNSLLSNDSLSWERGCMCLRIRCQIILLYPPTQDSDWSRKSHVLNVSKQWLQSKSIRQVETSSWPEVWVTNSDKYFSHYEFVEFSGSITSILIVSSATGEMVFPLLVGKVILTNVNVCLNTPESLTFSWHWTELYKDALRSLAIIIVVRSIYLKALKGDWHIKLKKPGVMAATA